MRFYWKQLPGEAEGIACKIMRAVEFPFKFDLRDECTAEEQQAMNMVRNVLEGEEYRECVKECGDSPELKDGILQSLLDDDVRIQASSEMPVGFAGFYELMGIVSHMVGMEESGDGLGRFGEGRPLRGLDKAQGQVVQVRRCEGDCGDEADDQATEGWQRGALRLYVLLPLYRFERILCLLQRAQFSNQQCKGRPTRT